MEEPPPLIEGQDYYVDPDGLYVFTASYLLNRGYCCRNGCRHCPYGFRGRPVAGDANDDARIESSDVD